MVRLEPIDGDKPRGRQWRWGNIVGGRIGDPQPSWRKSPIVIGVEGTMCAKGSVAGSVAVIVVDAGGCDRLARVPRRGPCAANVHIGVRPNDKQIGDRRQEQAPQCQEVVDSRLEVEPMPSPSRSRRVDMGQGPMRPACHRQEKAEELTTPGPEMMLRD